MPTNYLIKAKNLVLKFYFSIVAFFLFMFNKVMQGIDYMVSLKREAELELEEGEDLTDPSTGEIIVEEDSDEIIASPYTKSSYSCYNKMYKNTRK